MYDLSQGIFESENLLQRRPVLAAVLRQELRRELGFDFMDGPVLTPAVQPAKLDDETKDQIEALGYGGVNEDEVEPEPRRHRKRHPRKEALEVPGGRAKGEPEQ